MGEPPFASANAASFVPTAGAGTEGCSRLLCAIQWAPEDSALEAMLAQRPHWLQRHADTGVRTALLYASGWLVQWHEGPAAAVDAEWQRVRSLSRQRAVRLLHRSRGEAALLAGVQIASLHAADSAGDVGRRLRALEHQGSEREPVALWQALCAPCQLAPRGIAAVGRRDLVAVTSEDNEAVDVLRLLAQEAGLRIAYQRYAGTDLQRADVGASYLDLPQARDAVTRLHALPRRALVASTPMLGLRDVRHLVLLLGRHEQRARTLLAEAGPWLQGLPNPVAVVVASPCPRVRQLALESLAAVPGAQVLALDDVDPVRARAGLVSELVARCAARPAVTPASWPAGTAAIPSPPRRQAA